MLPIPAIDLKNQQCVRLKQGLMDEATIFSDNPVDMAGKWVEAGCQRLHLVDLDGAFAGKPINASVIADIVNTYPDVPIQIGGGIRSIETAKRYIDLGVNYVIIGTKAVEDPDFITELCQVFPDNVIVGIDAKNGYVATDGWAKVSDVKAVDLAKQFEGQGVQAIVYTDIAKDGMMQGVNIEQTAEMANAVDIPVIASGGVASMNDIKQLIDNPAPIFGAIIGRALYDGAIDLRQACTYAKKSG
ncbi:MAG: 1-(5-phosphoribosyl)-5-[(5-phosphoribosylamino)methylideneamino]imidazole-4-carboxamide isomerase [Gammaproteobacteria bacterium]|nr:MAG: 1-(5-phosphoribosyl)-5-[(5-phosphoribosylamino)methylideneamino]imidazole-4-carboxamide isomerase [Gammaproteobacteria bacterium]